MGYKMFHCCLLLLSKGGRCYKNWEELCCHIQSRSHNPESFLRMSAHDLRTLLAKNTEAMHGMVPAVIFVGGHT
jgi:hypothetical protein